MTKPKKPRKFPGPKIRQALEAVGIEVSLILDRLNSCVGCKKRKRSCRKLEDWANRFHLGKTDSKIALAELEAILKE